MTARKSEAGEMPFLDHLEELRWRIIRALIALLVGLAIGFFVALKFDIVALLATPIIPLLPNKALYFTAPAAAFSITLNAAMSIGVVLASPVVLYQAWAFLAPALYQGERRVIISILTGGVFLFASGAALAFFVVVPLSLPWLMGFGGAAMQPLITAEAYFGFVFAMVLTFGFAFELPIVILALAALGIVTPQMLGKYRRHAIVVLTVAGAFLTPGDMIWTTVALTVPLYLLYEISIVLARVVQRKREARKEEVSDVTEDSGAEPKSLLTDS